LNSERGQNLIEFALLTPILLLFIAAIANVGLALHTRSNLQQAVREGARQAAVGKTLTEVRNLAAGNSGGTLTPSEINWCLPTGSAGSVGDEVRVYIDEDGDGGEGYTYTILPATGVVEAFGMTDVSVPMNPRATARLEKSATGLPACAP